MLTLSTEAGLREAWRLIGRHAGSRELASRIATACPTVRLLGNGPFGWLELKRLLEPLGMGANKWEASPRSGGTILVGDYGWTESELIECVLSFRGGRLRMTCQQDLVYELLLVVERERIHAAHAEELASIKAAHPALRWIGLQFGWDRVSNRVVPAELVAPPPRAAAAEARASGWVKLPQSSAEVMPREGVLQASGYSVGLGGLPLEERRRALRTVMEEELPSGFHPNYAAQWGAPLTAGRLLKTAETLAALARNAKRRSASMDRAIAHWEVDLQWLRLEYSGLARTFIWPSSEIE